MPVPSDYLPLGHHTPEEVWYMLDNKTSRKYSTSEYRISISGKRNRRLLVFREKGLECIACGRTGVFFRSELHANAPETLRWYFNPIEYPVPVTHLNLYGYNWNGTLFLMTVDHVLPKSLGGSNTVENLVPMCNKCNGLKGNDVDWLKDLPTDKRGNLIMRRAKQKERLSKHA